MHACLSPAFVHILSTMLIRALLCLQWKHMMHPHVPKRCGKFHPGELASFDAQFFGVHGQQAKVGVASCLATFP